MASLSSTNRHLAVDQGSGAAPIRAGTAITSAQADTQSGASLDSSQILDTGEGVLPTGSSHESSGPTRAVTASGNRLTMLILGDSYSTTSSPLLKALDRELDSHGYHVKLITKAKAGASLEDGPQQLDHGLRGHKGTDAVLVLLGSNDGQHQTPIGTAEDQLDELLSAIDDRGISTTLVAGTYGDWPVQGEGYATPELVSQFEALFGRQADQHGDLLYDHILDGIYGVGGLTKDGEHPNRAGAQVIANAMSALLEELVSRAAADPN